MPTATAGTSSPYCRVTCRAGLQQVKRRRHGSPSLRTARSHRRVGATSGPSTRTGIVNRLRSWTKAGMPPNRPGRATAERSPSARTGRMLDSATAASWRAGWPYLTIQVAAPHRALLCREHGTAIRCGHRTGRKSHSRATPRRVLRRINRDFPISMSCQRREGLSDWWSRTRQARCGHRQAMRLRTSASIAGGRSGSLGPMAPVNAARVERALPIASRGRPPGACWRSLAQSETISIAPRSHRFRGADPVARARYRRDA
jgi:hypothetical protein